MRKALVLVAMFSGCSQPMPSTPDGEVQTVTRPMRVEANPKTIVYGEIYNDGVAVDEQRFDFALGDAYPRSLNVGVKPAYITRGCENGIKWGEERFLTLTDVTGDAAELSIIDGQLHVELKNEGTTSVLISGEIFNVACERSGVIETTIPSRHLATIRVSRVSKFTVTHPERCAGPMVVAAKLPTEFPTVTAHQSSGAYFEPMNAPEPVGITLRGPVESDGNFVVLSRGKTLVELDTTLPREGLKDITAVEPSQVTNATIELGLVRQNLKGSEWLTLKDGDTHRLLMFDDRDVVEVRPERIDTTEGTLCTPPGTDWFLGSTTTPDFCVAVAPNPEIRWDTVAKIIAPGECAMNVKLRDTNFAWNVKFTTTR